MFIGVVVATMDLFEHRHHVICPPDHPRALRGKKRLSFRIFFFVLVYNLAFIIYPAYPDDQNVAKAELMQLVSFTI